MADDFNDSDVFIQEDDIEIFPIPANDYIEILSKTTLSAELLVSIYDVSGLLLKQEKVSSEGGRYRLPLHNLKSGIYIMKLTLPDGNTVNKRLIIQ